MAGNPNSIIIRILGRKVRALIDTGAECSLISKHLYNGLKQKPKLFTNHNIALQTVSGKSLNVEGYVNLNFLMGGTKMTYKFYVVSKMCRLAILGRDWMVDNNVRIMFDLMCLKVNNTYVSLEEDIHINSVVRLTQDTIIKPQTAHILKGQLRRRTKLNRLKTYELKSIEDGYISTEPGLMVANSVIKFQKYHRCPILIVNSTNRPIKLKRGCPLAKVELIDEKLISSVTELHSQGKRNETPLDLNEIKAPAEHLDFIQNFVKSNRDVFAANDKELTQTNTITMKIPTIEHEPIKQKPYRVPLNDRKVLSDAIDEMLNAKVIRPSHSPYASPVVLVTKKTDNSKRFCVDYRKLNAVSKVSAWPLPNIDSILALLGDCKYFTTLDCRSGFWQIPIAEEDKLKTAFTTFRGLFEFNVMCFGLVNAPGIFQELMSKVLEGLDFVVAYIDDIVIFSKTELEHQQHLKIVFQRLREHNLKLKLKKCKFMQPKTEYLGFVIDENGISPNPDKVKAIKSLPVPKCVRDVRSILGAASFYRRFLKSFSKTAEPLINLTKKNAPFIWTSECQQSFDSIVQQLSKLPSLAFPNINKPYKLYTDASDGFVRACLTQEFTPENEANSFERPIYFLSHKLNNTQRKWSVIEKENFSIYYALQRLDHYLQGAQFTIYTDHRPLKSLMKTQINNKKIQLWQLSISSYNCSIEYLPGKKYVVADFLSRPPQPEIINTESDSAFEPEIPDKTYKISKCTPMVAKQINVINSHDLDPKEVVNKEYEKQEPLTEPLTRFAELDMKSEQNKDPAIVQLKMILKHGNPNKPEHRKFLMVDDILHYISDPDEDAILRLYVPSHLKALVIKDYHENNGHPGTQRMYATIKTKYYWPSLFKDLYSYVSTCVECQSRNLQRIKAPLKETNISPFPWAIISVDYIGPLDKTLSNNRYILCFIDMYSGYPEAFPTPDKSTDTAIDLLLNEIYPRYGCPLQIIHDQGSEFQSHAFKEVLKELNIDDVSCTAYHPESNSKQERMHRVLNDIIAKRVQGNTRDWDIHLNMALAGLRFNVSSSTKFSPHYLVFNRDAILPVDNLLRPRAKYTGEEFHRIALQEAHKSFLLAHKYLKQSKRKNKKLLDKKAKDIQFEINDPVYYMNFTKKNKLENRWKSHYRILEKIGPLTYIIKNQLDNSVVRVHADQIRLANVTEWPKFKTISGYPKRRANYVVPPDDSSSSYDESDASGSEKSGLKQTKNQRVKQERSNSSSEDNIPLAQLRKNLRSQDDNGANKYNVDKNGEVITESMQTESEGNGFDFSSANSNDCSLQSEPQSYDSSCTTNSDTITYYHHGLPPKNRLPDNSESESFSGNSRTGLQESMSIDAIKQRQINEKETTSFDLNGNKQECLKLLLSHIEKNVQSNNELVQNIFKKLF